MKSFWRIFEYIWPQWPRLIIIFVSAMLIGVLFSLSFMTIIPLLKVMMGEEGLHGWVDRKVCEQRYGIRFYMPERIDFIDPNKTDIAYYLIVTKVEEDGRAYAAGLREQDWIIGAGDSIVRDEEDKIVSSKLLEELAMAKGKTEIYVQVKRFDKAGGFELYEEKLKSGRRPFYLNSLAKVISVVPREQTTQNKFRAISLIIIMMAVFTLFRCIARFYQQYMAEKVSRSAIAQLRADTFAHVMDMPVAYFDREKPTDVVSRLFRDTKQFGIGVKILLGKTLREPFKAIALLAGAMIIDTKLTLIFLCSAPMVVAVVATLGKKIKRATKKSLLSWSLMLGKLNEAFGSLKVIKVYNQQGRENENFGKINNLVLRQLFRIAKIDSATGPIMEVLGMIAGGTALLFGAHWVANRQIEATEFITLIALLGTAAESIRKSSNIWNKIQQANAGAERVYAIADYKVEAESSDAFELEPLREKIEFKNIVFTYSSSVTPVLKDINLTIEAGHNVALVGPNGSGKTTLANLIPRLYDQDSGQILIDGKDIRDATLRSLRNQISLVTQNVVTFNDTVAANIAYGKTGATREEIIAAARRSFVDEFISPLPDGYDTLIGEHGVGFSGGQLQRIVIARAILKNPSILIFDEATSQVDAESEAKIHKAIEEIMQDRTSFIIAHRFSTVISADLIVVMSNGQIVDQGQHDELMKRCSLYQSLYETQLVHK